MCQEDEKKRKLRDGNWDAEQEKRKVE